MDVGVEMKVVSIVVGVVAVVAVGGAALAAHPSTTSEDQSSPTHQTQTATAETDKPTRGRVPYDAVDENGDFDLTKVPDFVPVLDSDGEGSAGWIRKEDAFPSTDNSPSPVFADDLETLVGHMYPMRGFVPLGTDPASVPKVRLST
jgi:hypothetical protein